MAKANGIYVIAKLRVENNKTESVTLTSEAGSLVSGENVYKPDTKAEVAHGSARAAAPRTSRTA